VIIGVAEGWRWASCRGGQIPTASRKRV
jgi:hypothetical protein